MGSHPALTLWHQRMAMGYRGQQAGRPSTWVYDTLWRAACWEAMAQQLEGQGMPALAVDTREMAASILTEES